VAGRGHRKLFLDTVTQSDRGLDLDFDLDFDFLAAPVMRGKVPPPKWRGPAC
jgi:hypothetical protein